MPEIKIGSPVWVYDMNHRKYVDGKPVYRYHWVKTKIIGETKVSWIIERGNVKLPKKDFALPFGLHKDCRTFALSEEDIDADVWSNDHRPKIRNRVDYCDVDTLKAIAKLLGYNP